MSSTINKVTLDALIVRVNELEQQISLLLSAKAVDVSDKKKEKKEKKEKKVADPDKPKQKRTSGYILYSNASRDDVKDSLGGVEGEKPKNTDIMKKLAENWKQLDDDERAKWNDKAKELREQDNE